MADKDFKVKQSLDVGSPVPISEGGTGQSSAANALNALLPVQTSGSGKYLKTDGTNPAWDFVAGSVYSGTAPSNPVLGQVWVDSSVDVSTLDKSVFARYQFVATNNQTTFTTSSPFGVGYEQVFLNGVLLLRTTDYTTPKTTSVVLNSVAATGDELEIFAISPINTYTEFLPSQGGNSGKYLTTNGSSASWATLDTTSIEINNIMGAY